MEEQTAVVVESSALAEIVTAESIIKAHKDVVDVTWRLMETGNAFVQKAAAVGRLLIAKKEELGHGNWMPWLAENIKEFGIDTAQDYIKAARYSDRGPILTSGSLRSVRDLRQAVGMLEDKPEKNGQDRVKPAFVIRCSFNVDPNSLDYHQRRDAFEQAKPILEAFESFGFIEIKAA